MHVKSSKLHISGVLQELCGAAMSAPGGGELVQRLADELLSAGQAREAETIRKLVPSLDAREPAADAPDAASSLLAGEPLTRSSRVPVDRETAAPVATILVAKSMPEASPILPDALSTAVNTWVTEWSRAGELKAIGIEPARSCVLFGDPGTGKTELALWLARQMKLPVILARLDGLMSSFLGTTSRNIGNLFAFANRHRALLILDEFDAIAKLRDDPNEVGEIKRVVNTLLQNLDERARHGLTIGITNHPQLLDPAVWRRFELQIEMPKPDQHARTRIIERYAKPLEFGRAQSKLLACILEGASGAEIQDVVNSLKKSWILDGLNVSFAERLQTVICTHAARVPKQAIEIVNTPLKEFARVVLERYSFTTVEVGEIFGVNRTTISRWVT
ncbi:TPA: AAA family ATPase [Burkholderia cepacia]|uniref:AAA family ATPase n=1 Tax=Burkholderia cepacia TaxID=292 RepID=UPI000D2F2601|nr:ATP-binding protein [Burkholderia cepacia]MCA8357637.1 ATP-binding protein [Burkholderia cepacia]HDV6370379.1 ATP-binding protein [Burkholderia cepacia]